MEGRLVRIYRDITLVCPILANQIVYIPLDESIKFPPAVIDIPASRRIGKTCFLNGAYYCAYEFPTIFADFFDCRCLLCIVRFKLFYLVVEAGLTACNRSEAVTALELDDAAAIIARIIFDGLLDWRTHSKTRLPGNVS